MGARYIWNRYTAIPQQIQRQRYRVVYTSESNAFVNLTKEQDYKFWMGTGCSCYSTTGEMYLTGSIREYQGGSGHTGDTYGSGYILMANNTVLYSSNWKAVDEWLGGDGFGLRGGSRRYSSEQYTDYYTIYLQGSYIDQRSNASSGAYPSNDESGGYYYVRQGSDEVDPTAVTVPDDIDDGTTIQISITPNTGKTFGGTISYTYQYRYDGGSWQTLSTTTATTVSLAVPKGQYSTLEVRVRAQDDMGFTSNTWVSSGSKTIIANQPPTAPGISVENVYIGNTLTVTLTAATDPDGTVASYVIQRRIDGGAWTQVQSGTSMTYSETVLDAWGTVAYRAAALDNESLQGPWATSQTFDVNPGWVIIEGPESDIGDKRRPFHFVFSVGVVGSPDEDDILTRVMLDDRYTVVDRTFHDADVVDIRLDIKYFAQGPHKLQITADKEGYTGAMSTYTFNVTNDEAEALLAGANAGVAQNYLGEPIVYHGLARFVYGPDGRDVVQMCGDGLKLAHGSYTGTGTSGSGSPNTLTCGFRPKVATIAAADGSAVIRLAAPAEGNTATAGGVTATFADSGLSWYADSAAAQLNASGTGYIYEIIG